MARKKRKTKESNTDGYGVEGGWNEDFAFIAGFTSGGFPYGLSWEETEGTKEKNEYPVSGIPEDELPF